MEVLEIGKKLLNLNFLLFLGIWFQPPAKKRIKVLSIGEPIICASVKVRTGDIIVADGTGVLCIPIEHLDVVINDAEKYTSDDNQAMSEMKQGLTFIEALSKFKKI